MIKEGVRPVSMYFAPGGGENVHLLHQFGADIQSKLTLDPRKRVAVMVEDNLMTPLRAQLITDAVAGGELTPSQAYAAGTRQFREDRRSRSGRERSDMPTAKEVTAWKDITGYEIPDELTRAEYVLLDQITQAHPRRILLLPQGVHPDDASIKSTAKQLGTAVRKGVNGDLSVNNAAHFAKGTRDLHAFNHAREREMAQKFGEGLDDPTVVAGVSYHMEGHAGMEDDLRQPGRIVMPVFPAWEEGDTYLLPPLEEALAERRSAPPNIDWKDFIAKDEGVILLAQTVLHQVKSRVEQRLRNNGVEARTEQQVRRLVKDVTADYDEAKVAELGEQLTSADNKVAFIDHVLEGGREQTVIDLAPTPQQTVRKVEQPDLETREMGIDAATMQIDWTGSGDLPDARKTL